ncbi:MAG: UvrD-helicase domain-containing protein, partial [Gammaproteobacteria bacterium]
QSSATVSASAGTGKTWLLVSRIIRILLAGARPDAILAITFTRKAAAEMQSRLASRLFQFAAADDAGLVQLLQQIQAPTDPDTLTLARGLYECLLHSPQKVRASTFHSFCQDILRRFPLDAGIAPGFELIEDTAQHTQEAWDIMVREATMQTEGKLAGQLDAMMDYCHGLHNTQDALFSFLEHRSDWWAYTLGQASPVEYAANSLKAHLDVDPTIDPLVILRAEAFASDVKEFAQWLAKHPIKSNAAYEAKIYKSLELIDAPHLEEAFNTVYEVFFTQEGKPRARKENQTQAKKMGAAGQQRFLELHEILCARLLDITNQRYRLQLYRLCCVWYELGQNLLDRFQRLKTEQRLLDFSDLEWKTYTLLNHTDNAHWVQYKLDQRIDHLLIDEFQDTNPTQWQLIIPLLEELAAGNNERQRSVFLVGDHKQSIYRFRRAAPELFDAAQHWLQQSLDAVNQPLSTSWRSAPAIMQCVNWVFADGPLSETIHQFSTHYTHHKSLWGQVELLPLAKPTVDSTPMQNDSTSLRNPLLQPRLETQDTRHYEEGKMIATKIKALIDQPTWIEADGEVRKLSYKDIMILLRHRTHANAYEKSLREAGIPYVGAERGTLLNTLEAQDMVALLETLVTPYNNLALATVLRSPLFSCSNDQLILLSNLRQGTWLQRLQAIAQQSEEPELRRAHELITDWSTLAGILPVHDLLDRIYNQGNLLNRYEAAYPEHLKHRVRANLTRFLELALEIDSGRYPSIGNFLSRLKTLRDQVQNGPDEVSALDAQSKVQIMTIHASKGMEAPVVFLADATDTQSTPKAYQAIVDWPAGQPRPKCLLLAPPKKQQDDIVQSLLAHNLLGEQKEAANLLYVALTRAKQVLCVSGCEPSRGTNLGWYGQVREQMRRHMDLQELDDEHTLTYQSGEAIVPATHPSSSDQEILPATTPLLAEHGLKGPFHNIHQLKEIAPSYELAEPLHGLSEPEQKSTHKQRGSLDEDKQTKGNVIHRVLHLLSERVSDADIAQWIRVEYGVDLQLPPWNQWLLEAKQVIDNPRWRFLYDPNQYNNAYNEVPLMYQQNNDTVYGFIDRLVVTGNKIYLVDYKTHDLRGREDIDAMTARHLPQLRLYQQGIAKCWPDVPVECYLLFTHNAVLKPVPI